MAEARRQVAPTRPTLFIDDIHDVSEHGDIFRAIVGSGSEAYPIACSPHIAIKTIELLTRAHDKWSKANQTAQGIRTKAR